MQKFQMTVWSLFHKRYPAVSQYPPLFCEGRIHGLLLLKVPVSSRCIWPFSMPYPSFLPHSRDHRLQPKNGVAPVATRSEPFRHHLCLHNTLPDSTKFPHNGTPEANH